MKVTPTSIPEVLIIEPKVFGDARGFFFESFNQKAFNEATGLDVNFVQDNHSRSAKGVLRGLHYRFSSRRASWCGWCRARFLTLPLTFANLHQLLVSGSEKFCLQITSVRCGYLKALRMGL